MATRTAVLSIVSAVCLAAALWLPIGMGRSGPPVSYASLAARRCKIVVKKVHGHRKKVHVCKKAHPTAVPPLFDGPSDLVVNARGNVLVADQLTRSVVTLSPNGKLLSRWTTAGANPTGFDQLYGIALDGTGNVYVTDAANHVLDKLDPSGNPLAQWSVNPTEPAGFPTLLAVGSDGAIYVADHTAESVLHLSPGGALLGTIGKGELADPYGVTSGSDGNLYVTDYAGNRVREYRTDGTAVASWGDGTQGTVNLQKPEAIVLDHQGNLYVTEGSGHIVKFDATGKVLADWGGTSAQLFSDPSGIALDPQGNIYVTEYEGNKVDKLSPDGALLATWQ